LVLQKALAIAGVLGADVAGIVELGEEYQQGAAAEAEECAELVEIG